MMHIIVVMVDENKEVELSTEFGSLSPGGGLGIGVFLQNDSNQKWTEDLGESWITLILRSSNSQKNLSLKK